MSTNVGVSFNHYPVDKIQIIKKEKNAQPRRARRLEDGWIHTFWNQIDAVAAKAELLHPINSGDLERYQYLMYVCSLPVDQF